MLQAAWGIFGQCSETHPQPRQDVQTNPPHVEFLLAGVHPLIRHLPGLGTGCLLEALGKERSL